MGKKRTKGELEAELAVKDTKIATLESEIATLRAAIINMARAAVMPLPFVPAPEPFIPAPMPGAPEPHPFDPFVPFPGTVYGLAGCIDGKGHSFPGMWLGILPPSCASTQTGSVH